MSRPVRAKITALGTYVPPKLLTNQDLERLVETSHEWVMERTGIRERHIAERMRASSEVGFHTFIAEMPAPYDVETLERWIGEVKPMVEA